jgi:gas vesicle protein
MLGGAAAGGAAAYTTAPRSGIETRRRIQAITDDASESVEHVPVAPRKASEAARDAFFNEALRVDIQAV